MLGLSLTLTSTAQASGSGMPWEQPLQQVLESVQGPVAKIVAVIIIITTGLTLAFGETAGGFRRLIQIIFGLSIAFAASSFFLSFFSFGGGALAPIHASLGSPILLGGAPRAIAIVNGTIAAAVGLGLQQWLVGIALWAVGHKGVSGMLNLAEYRLRADRLADHLPWAALVAPGVVLNKDGSFQRSFAFRGPDLESATEAELVSACARANNVLKRLGTGWALFFEAERRGSQGYPESVFPDAASWLVDQERRAGFKAERQHFESIYHGTLTWLPPADSSDAAGRSLVERPDDAQGRDWRASLAGFIAETDRILDLLSGFMPEVRALDDAETLTYLHGTISDRSHAVATPETPIYLDALLADTPLIGGLEPKLGRTHLRTLTVLGFPNLSRPGILDALNHRDFGYRWVTRFIALDKQDATK
ncbi:hypothetical protein LTR94_026212, partial [Friedmanniomyces endolithicus]